MIIKKYRETNIKIIKNYETQDVTDIVKEWMFLDRSGFERITVHNFSNNLKIEIGIARLVVYKEEDKYIGQKRIADIKDLPTFLLILEGNPRFGDVNALDILLEK